jgi:Ca-activated chloride channel family protein
MHETAKLRPLWKIAFSVALFIGFPATNGPSEVQDDESSTISVSVNLVKVPISVFDHSGNLVNDLRKEDFRIWEDQAQQKIRSFGIDRNPVSVVLVVDTSMSGKKELKKIKEAAEEFAEALSHGDQISLISFDDQVYKVLDWTEDRKQVKKALSKLRSGWRTALYDALYAAAKDQLEGIEGRKAIILLTDSLDNQSRQNFKNASLAVVESQASLYIVSKTVIVREQARHERRVIILDRIYKRLFGKDTNYIDEFFEKRESEMKNLAEQTGGRCFFPIDYDQIKGVYSEVARELKSKHYLTYVSNQDMLQNSYHRISIEYLRPASKIIYRKGYYYEPQHDFVPVRRLYAK